MAFPIVPGMINFLHDLFTSLWIGGLAFMVLILMPVVRKYFEDKKEGEAFQEKAQNRLKIVVYISMVGLIVTGILMSVFANNSGYGHPFSFVNTYSTIVTIKHILVILMVIITITKSQILDRLKSPSMALKKARMILIPINLFLGIAVLVLSGFSAAIAAMI